MDDDEEEKSDEHFEKDCDDAAKFEINNSGPMYFRDPPDTFFYLKDEDKCKDDTEEEDWAITDDFWIKPREFSVLVSHFVNCEIFGYI